MSLITVVAKKESEDAKVGIAFQRIQQKNGTKPVIITKISETSIFADTALAVEYELLEINDTPVTPSMSTTDAVDMLKQAEGEVKLLARQRFGDIVEVTIEKTSADMKSGIVLLNNVGYTYIKEYIQPSVFENLLPTGPSHEIVSINETDVKGQSPSGIASVLAAVEPGPFTVTMHVAAGAALVGHTHKKMPLVTAVATKESKDTKAGVSLGRVEEDGQKLIVVTNMSESCIFNDTALKPEYSISSINSVSVAGKTVAEAIQLIKDAEGEVTILARRRCGAKVEATAEKLAGAKTNIVLSNSKGYTYVKEYIEPSPFVGLLPVGPTHEISAINGTDVVGQSPREVAAVLAAAPEGPLTIEMVNKLLTSE